MNKNDIEKIINIKAANQFKKYIDFIQFPFYRNLELDQRINFEFPLIVFIGQNGCGKSSCLHALYGAPLNKTPYDFWFDTKVDPVSYYNEQRKRHSFWYSYKDESGITREVIKARIKRGNDPNYWETSRPLKWAGMKKRNDRDKPIDKNVVYMDFRSELSSFDKFFYFGNVKKLKSINKQEYIRKKSISMKKVLDGEIEFIKNKNGKVNNSLEFLTKKQLKWISFILGRHYKSAKYLEHTFFQNYGYSVLFSTNYADYSEAFAGSGEVAIVKLVTTILNSPQYSLILLDEPEVSLHPGAQHRLVDFLINEIISKKHQIIISTHSQTITKNLPDNAIKAFYKNPKNNRFKIKENLTYLEAFYYIELPLDTKKNIYVEDNLAKMIIESVIDSFGDETKNIFRVQFHPGGESTIKKDFITFFCREHNSNNYIIFDGDIKPKNNHYKWQDFRYEDINYNFLKQKIKEQTKQDIHFDVDGKRGKGNQIQKIELFKKYLDFYFQHVFYLPKNIPEDIIWDKVIALNLIKENVVNTNQFENEIHNLGTKDKFSYISNILFNESNADHIEMTHKLFIQKWRIKGDQSFKEIKKIIDIIRHA